MSKKATKQENQENESDLKFLGLEIENFKNLEKRKVDIGGQSIMVIGKNGTGKSSIIQALMSPLNSKMLPTEPIKKGEERAKISVTIGGNHFGSYSEYILDMYFTAKDKKGRLTVTNADGESVKSPATFIKGLIGNVSFDIMKWLHDDKANKLKTIKALTGVSDEIDIIDIQIKKTKDDRKYKKQRAEDLEAILNNHAFTPQEIDVYSRTVDLLPIQQEMAGIAKAQKDYDGVVNKLNEFSSNVSRLNNSIAEKQEEILRLQNQIEGLSAEITSNTENIKKGNEWLSVHARPSIEAVNEKINQAILHNEKCSQIGNLASHQREMITCKEEANKMSVDITALEDKKLKIISNSQFNIPGLTFTDDDIFLDNIPLEEGQVNTARLFEIGTEVAIAMNPNLKVIFLHDASLFDHDALKTIIRKVEERGFQLVVELVSEDNEAEVKFTEEMM
jgi:DNA repair ATPase RecN